MEINDVGVIGAGTMGHGIAQVAAMAGCDVVLFDLDDAAVERGLSNIKRNLEKGVERGKVEVALAVDSLSRISGTTELGAVGDGVDLVVEAVPEKLELKQTLFGQLEKIAPEEAIFATNTSSLSISKIASGLLDPGRVIGMHFFNPVHIMALLELVVHAGTRADVVATSQAFGARIGKEVITVKDFPGFATSRLGVCLGMEAIRMVEQGVAAPGDIDAAMVLGYRHPVGPLKLTDMVGLDVRMHIGEYLAQELGNAAFEPPELMRQMVAEGKLGKKSGQGFYSW
jgi:3-hydroxybutyryl-CoA dehydrogenase